MLTSVRERLVEAQRFDGTVELAQRVKPFRGTTAGVTHEIIKSILACDDYNVCDAIGQRHFFGFAVFTADYGKGRRMKEELRSESRSLRSL